MGTEDSSMGKSVDIVALFGDDVVHLHGNLYRVRRKRIRMAKSGVSVKNGRFVYGNPRWFLNKRGQLEAKGIESSKMEELKSSIKHSGLDNPIRVRPVGDGHLEIVNGERRFRCIGDLCDSDDKCYSPVSGEMVPASEVYDWVDCRIEVMDDKDALGVALKTNETSEVIGDLASIYVVKTLRAAGFDDQDILCSTGKSLSWLRETDRIIGLDEVCLNHFESDQITRKAAIQLALVENAEERLSLLESIVGMAQERKTARLKSIDEKVERADDDFRASVASSEAAAEKGELKKAEMLAAKGKGAKERGDKARDERSKLESKPAKADAHDIKTVRSSKKKPEPKPEEKSDSGLSVAISSYSEMIEQVIAAEGFDDEGESLGINLETLSAVLGVLSAIMEGEEDIMSVLSSNCPLEVQDEDEDEDAQEDSDEESEDEDDGSTEGDELYSEFSEEDDDAAPEDEMEFRGAAFNEDEYD